MSTLNSLRTRVQQFLLATGVTAWNAETIDEMIRQALAEYSQANPRQVETVLTCPAAGREIALNALSELATVLDVWWPYSSTVTPQKWPPNRVRGFRLDWDDGQPLLTLTGDAGDQPASGDEVRIWYTTPQHLDGLDGAAGTTLPLVHESLVVIGAAALAAAARAALPSQGTSEAVSGQKWADAGLAQFHSRLDSIRGQVAARGPAFGQGWQLDDWENTGVTYPLPVHP